MLYNRVTDSPTKTETKNTKQSLSHVQNLQDFSTTSHQPIQSTSISMDEQWTMVLIFHRRGSSVKIAVASASWSRRCLGQLISTQKRDGGGDTDHRRLTKSRKLFGRDWAQEKLKCSKVASVYKLPADRPNGQLSENRRYPKLPQYMGEIWSHWVGMRGGSNFKCHERFATVKSKGAAQGRWGRWQGPGSNRWRLRPIHLGAEAVLPPC